MSLTTLTSIVAMVLYLATIATWLSIHSVTRILWFIAGLCPILLAIHCLWEINGADPVFNSLFSLLTSVLGLLAAYFVKHFVKRLP